MTGLAVRARGLAVGRGRPAPGWPALDDVALELAGGGRLAVLGASGAGKTTLLRVLAGLEAPDAGVVELDGRAATDGPRVLVPPEARGVGLVFQELALWPHLTVGATLELVAPPEVRRRARAARRAWAADWAARVDLAGRLDDRPDALSGGERQRLALARALAPGPGLLLLDEPFAHVDAPRRDALAALVAELVAAAGATLVLVTHDRRDAFALADAVLVLDRGRAVERGPLADVAARPRRAETVRLLGLGAVVSGRPVEGGLACALGLLPLAPGAGPPEDGLAGAPLAGARAAALVRPDQVAWTPSAPGGSARETGGADPGVPARVIAARLARPDASARRWAATLAVEGVAGEGDAREARVEALFDAPPALGALGRVHVTSPCVALTDTDPVA